MLIIKPSIYNSFLFLMKLFLLAHIVTYTELILKNYFEFIMKLLIFFFCFNKK